MEEVQSSNLAAIGYDADSKCLQVRFLNGALWRYHTVPQSAYEGLQTAGSVGSYFHKYIRSVYPAEQVDE